VHDVGVLADAISSTCGGDAFVDAFVARGEAVQPEVAHASRTGGTQVVGDTRVVQHTTKPAGERGRVSGRDQCHRYPFALSAR
jgi:hypothetical protein